MEPGRNVSACRTSYGVKTDEDMTFFDELYDMYHAHVYRFACALAGDARDAEDLFQETWLRAVRALPAGRETEGSDPKVWLFTIVANAHKDSLRKKRVRRRVEGARGSVGPEKCPGCGNSVATGHAFCPYCGKNLKRTCPACGKAVEGNWKACPSCGAGIDPGEVRQA